MVSGYSVISSNLRVSEESIRLWLNASLLERVEAQWYKCSFIKDLELSIRCIIFHNSLKTWDSHIKKPNLLQTTRIPNSVRKGWRKHGPKSCSSEEKTAYILFGDEASFPQWGSLAYTWAKRGQQPVVKTPGKRRGYKVFGLIDYFYGRFFCNRHNQIWPKSGRRSCEVILVQALSPSWNRFGQVVNRFIDVLQTQIYFKDRMKKPDIGLDFWVFKK